MNDFYRRSKTPSLYDCPVCGSDHTQKVSAVYEAGTADTEGRSSHTGVAWAGEGDFIPAIGSSKQTGTQQTDLAKRLAPPALKEWGAAVGCVPMIAAVVGSISLAVIGLPCFVGFTLTFVVVLLLMISSTQNDRAFNRDQLPKLKDEWQKKWYCHRCGEVFDLSSSVDE